MKAAAWLSRPSLNHPLVWGSSLLNCTLGHAGHFKKYPPAGLSEAYRFKLNYCGLGLRERYVLDAVLIFVGPCVENHGQMFQRRAGRGPGGREGLAQADTGHTDKGQQHRFLDLSNVFFLPYSFFCLKIFF